jgi:xylose isomerase
MRTYLILKEKAQRFNNDAEIQGILKELHSGGDSEYSKGYSKEAAEKLKSHNFDVTALTNRSLPYEKLDQAHDRSVARRALKTRALAAPC